jgi:hypothetical protein
MEKNILAYFKSPDEANEVLSKLQALRVIDARIDRIARYPGDSPEVPRNPSQGQMTGLPGLTQGSIETNMSAGILVAADPAASGMSDGGAGGVTGRDILLTAVVDESVHHKALRIVEEAGGMV